MVQKQTIEQGEDTFAEFELPFMGKGVKKRGSKPYGV